MKVAGEPFKQTKSENMAKVEPMEVDEDGEGKGGGCEGKEARKKKMEGKQEQGKEQEAGGNTGIAGWVERGRMESNEDSVEGKKEAVGVKRKFVDGEEMEIEGVNVVE